MPYATPSRAFLFNAAAIVFQTVIISPVSADTVLTLNKDFIEKFKSRVTIDADYIVDKAPPASEST